MIPAREWDAYNMAVDRVCSQAESAATRAVLAAVRAGELSGLGVAETREQVKAVLEPVATAYAEAASELAAEWYDTAAEGHGYKLPAAVTQVDGCGGAVDAAVRYQMSKLMDGDAEGFARACGALARDAAVRQLNSTVMANAARDRKLGVRFARVTTGRETCAFCYMLASRGAVYYTRETAGQFNHYHRRCDCKVVPGFGEDPDAVLVEGHDPALMRSRMKLIEEQTGLSFANKGDLGSISKDMSLRDMGWLYSVSSGEVRYETERARNELNSVERKTLEAVSANGYRQIVRERSNLPGRRTSDVFLGGVAADFKTPRGEGFNCIDGLLRHAASQASVAIVHLVPGVSTMSERDAERHVANACKRRRLSGVLLIGYDGNMRWVVGGA